MNEDFDFFISYRRAAAGKIIHDIKNILTDFYPYNVFLDLVNLQHSNDWKKSINDNLKKSRVILVVLAKGSFESEHANSETDEFLYEIGCAKGLNKPLITIDYDGFFSAKEYQRINDKSIVEWLNRPTALSFRASEHEDRKNLISGIIEKMKSFDNEIDSFGGYLPEAYLDDQKHILRNRAKKFFENDGRIDHDESYKLFELAKEKHINRNIVIEIIEEFEGKSRPTSQSQLNETPPTINTNSSVEKSQVFKADFDQAPPPKDFLKGDSFVEEVTSLDCDQWDYHSLGSRTVANVLASPDIDDLASYIAFYAFGDEDLGQIVIDTLEIADANLSVKNVIKKYGRMLEPDEVGNFSVADAQRWSLAQVIAEVIGQSNVAAIERTLEETHGRTKVWKAFADRWPEGVLDEEPSDDLIDWDYRALGEMKAGEVLAHADSSYLIDRICESSGISTQTIKKHLTNADSEVQVKNIVKGYQDVLDPTCLGMQSVAGARKYQLGSVIADVLGIADFNEIERILETAHGKTLLRKAFSSHWPS